MKELHPGTSNTGFLDENYFYNLMSRSKLTNRIENTSTYIYIYILSGSKHSRLAFSRSPGGFRELREADGKHFHLSWHLYIYIYSKF